MVFVAPLLVALLLVALIAAGIADSCRYDANDPEYWRKKREKQREWERRQTRNNSFKRIWK